MLHDIVLEGHGVRLRQLEPADAPRLAEIVDDGMWTYMSSPFPDGVEAWAVVVAKALDSGDRMPFAVVDVATGDVVGSTSFYERAPAQHRVEIGYTFYARAVWGTRINPACKRLLLGQAFDTWECRRVALRCDVQNLRSAAAIQKLGATFEGNLRRHRTQSDGSPSDTSYFSIIDSEWAQVREALDLRLGASAG